MGKIQIWDPQHWIIHVRLGVEGEAVVHSRSPTDSLCLEDAELPYDQVGYNLFFVGSGIRDPKFGIRNGFKPGCGINIPDPQH
jgi:hypothetical protein